MENNTSQIKPIIESTEAYIKTVFQLNKLRFLDVLAETTSTGISRLVLILLFSFFLFTATIALALWLGQLLGKNHYGFLLVAGFYGIAALIALGLHNSIKRKINTAMIRHIFKR